VPLREESRPRVSENKTCEDDAQKKYHLSLREEHKTGYLRSNVCIPRTQRVLVKIMPSSTLCVPKRRTQTEGYIEGT
jgi:hypothetical protein